MKRFSARLLLLRAWVLIWLMLVWILLWGSFTVANAIGGLVIGLLITVLLPMPRVPVQGKVHLLSLLHLLVQVAWSLLVSSIQVAWLAIRPGPPPLSAVLRAHVNVKSDLVLALAVNIFNLIPGSIVLEIDQVRRIIYAHVIDVGSERGLNRFYRQVADTERLLIAAFERDSEWRPSTREDNDHEDNAREDNEEAR